MIDLERLTDEQKGVVGKLNLNELSAEELKTVKSIFSSKGRAVKKAGTRQLLAFMKEQTLLTEGCGLEELLLDIFCVLVAKFPNLLEDEAWDDVAARAGRVTESTLWQEAGDDARTAAIATYIKFAQGIARKKQAAKGGRKKAADGNGAATSMEDHGFPEDPAFKDAKEVVAV